MSLPRVLLADDHALLLGAYERLLAGECDIIGQVRNGRALIEVAQKLKPDVVVLDISMPLLNGLEAGRQLKQNLDGVELVFVTMYEDPELAAEAFRAGASGYVLKHSTASELAVAIKAVMQGRLYVTPLVAGGLLDLLVDAQKSPSQLTSRQREVLQLIGVAEGTEMKEVGAPAVRARTNKGRSPV